MILLFMFRHSLLLERFMPPLQKQVDASGAIELRGPLNFHYKILRDATRNFDASNKVGEGGFGQVYKGTIENGKTVAVKKLSLGQSPRVIAEFEGEVKLISNVRHRNLVRLLGFCNKGLKGCLSTNTCQMAVWTEFYSNSNCIVLQTGENRECLSWEQRFEIMVGTARGIAYLHEDFYARIIHRDIKCGNILLDENFYPKIADFGLARLLPGDQSHLSTRYAGTLVMPLGMAIRVLGEDEEDGYQVQVSPLGATNLDYTRVVSELQTPRSGGVEKFHWRLLKRSKSVSLWKLSRKQRCHQELKNGLRQQIKDEMIMVRTKTVDEAYHYATKVEEKTNRYAENKTYSSKRGAFQRGRGRGDGASNSRVERANDTQSGQQRGRGFPMRGRRFGARGRGFATRGRGGRGVCFRCGQFGHRTVECP
eukprot:Gb_28649 [translate_table: standard]